MQTTAPDFETLNAYVDGELDAEHAAEVARAVAEDSQLAHQVAVLSQLRSAVVESIDTPPLELPQHISPARYSFKPLAVAACVAGLVAVGAFLLDRMSTDSTMAEWIPPAWQIHQAWDIPSTETSDENNAGEFVPVSSVDGMFESYIPDLTSAKLSVAYVSNDYLYQGKETLLVGYTGTRGCKVTLLVSGGSVPLSDQMTFFQRDKVSLYGWHIGNLDYMLMAEGMAPERFHSIADAVYQSTKIRLPVDRDTQLKLAESRAKSAPCMA